MDCLSTDRALPTVPSLRDKLVYLARLRDDLISLYDGIAKPTSAVVGFSPVRVSIITTRV